MEPGERLSCFDEATKAVRAARTLDEVADIEANLIAVATLAAADHEFPLELKGKVFALVALNRLRSRSGGLNLVAESHVRTIGGSLLVETLSLAFGELARSEVVTRFGRLESDPRAIINRRRRWEAGERPERR